MKVGIITLLYKNINYGGNLQAYALCRYLKNFSVEVEQIQYQSCIYESVTAKLQKELHKGFYVFLKNSIKRIHRIICDFPKKIKGLPYKRRFKDIIKKREEAFTDFYDINISHSSEIYTSETICNCVNNYDVFITGSDQVWNFAWYDSAYFLDFVPSNVKKVSYAASISMNELNSKQKEIIKASLMDYHAISVREQSAVDLLNNVIDKDSVLVLDPTLLLEKSDWNEVCTDRLIGEEYVFCYFIGENSNAGKIAKEFAKQKGIKLVNIPFASGWFNLTNINLGDMQITDASPQKFLSLIKYASYVFTDSFHAVVFSFIFQKQFFVFNREKKGTMNTRIKNLTQMLELEERFCSCEGREMLKYIIGLQDIDYTVEFKQIDEYRQKSYDFIRINVLDGNIEQNEYKKE